MQELIIRYFLAPLSRFFGTWSEKCRERIALTAGMGIVTYFFLYHMEIIRWRYMYSFAGCGLLLGVMFLMTLPKEIKPVRFRLIFGLYWFGAGGLMLLSALRNNPNYLPEALMLLVVYPFFYISWANGEAEKYFRLLVKLSKISLVLFFVISFLFSQITTRRYSGLFTNFNNCSGYLALAGVCLILELLYEPESKRRNIVNILLFGMSYGLIVLTNSRSGKLALLFSVGVGVVWYAWTHRSALKIRFFVKAAVCVLLCCVMSTGLMYAFQFRQVLPLPYYDREYHGFYFTVDGLPGREALSGVETEDSLGFFNYDSFENYGEKKTTAEGKSLDEYSAGRISVWTGYLKRLTLFGVKEKESFYLDGYDTYLHTAHMTILEIAYESGIFAGVLYLLMNLISGFTAIWYAVKKRKEAYALMPLMVILTFGIISVLGSFNSSFNYLFTLYYYLVLFPLITDGPKHKRIK